MTLDGLGGVTSYSRVITGCRGIIGLGGVGIGSYSFSFAPSIVSIALNFPLDFTIIYSSFALSFILIIANIFVSYN